MIICSVKQWWDQDRMGKTETKSKGAIPLSVIFTSAERFHNYFTRRLNVRRLVKSALKIPWHLNICFCTVLSNICLRDCLTERLSNSAGQNSCRKNICDKTVARQLTDSNSDLWMTWLVSCLELSWVWRHQDGKGKTEAVTVMTKTETVILSTMTETVKLLSQDETMFQDFPSLAL